MGYFKWDKGKFSLLVLTAQSHLLRKVVDPTTGRLYLGLFLYLADNTQVRLEIETISALLSSYQYSGIDFQGKTLGPVGPKFSDLVTSNSILISESKLPIASGDLDGHNVEL